MRFNNPLIMNALNAATAKTSGVISAQQLYQGSIQASFSSATLAGTVALQGSNDCQELLPMNADPIHWSTIGTPATVAAGALTLLLPQQLAYKYLRVVWTPSAGTGTITVCGMFLGF